VKRIAFAVAMVLAACSPQAQDRAAAAASAPVEGTTVHPISGLEVIPLTISQNGNVRHFRVEVASTDEEQQRGLMFREKMDPDEGMLFPHDPPRMASFWMKNTVLPLDIVFIGTDHRITNVSANAAPYSLDPRMSDGLTVAVLELNGGRLAALGFTPGALVEW
jgi:uncharacterized membrane protein (UPF0127 family)